MLPALSKLSALTLSTGPNASKRQRGGDARPSDNDDSEESDEVLLAEEEEGDPDDDFDLLGRIAGRAAMLFQGTTYEYFLVVWNRSNVADTAVWLQQREFDTPKRRALLETYKRDTGKADPEGLGWVRKVRDSRERGRGRLRHTEHKIEWLMDEDIPRIERLFDWVRREELLEPDNVLGKAADSGGGGGEEDRDPRDDGAEDNSDDGGERRPGRWPLPPEPGDGDGGEESNPLAGASSASLVWDAGSQRAKISIARTIAELDSEPPWLVLALEEWCVWRLYLLQALVPREANVSINDWEQLGEDLYKIDRIKLDALNPVDSGKSSQEHEREQRDMLIQRADAAWRRRRVRRERDTSLIEGQLQGLRLIQLQRGGVGAGASSQLGSPPLSFLKSDDNSVLGPESIVDYGVQNAQILADSKRIASAAEGGTRWWVEFASPPARMHAQGNLLLGSREVGGNRNASQTAYLTWIRNTMTEKEAELRVRKQPVNGRQRQRVEYNDEWMNGAWGSPYSTFWPAGKRATSTSVNLEHIVCSEWLRGGEIVKETGYPRQDATICCLANQNENSARNDKPVSVFGPEKDTNNQRLYSPPDSNTSKRGLLAKATAHGLLGYPFVQQETKSAGSKLFAGAFGVSEYSRRLWGLRRYALWVPTAWERRLALVNAVRHKWHNPLVLRPALVHNPRFAAMLDMRLRGGRAPRGVLECGLALLVDSQLRGLEDGPV